MLLDRKDQFLNVVRGLKPRPRRALLEGKITLSEAQELSGLSRLKSRGIDALIDRLHTQRHKDIDDQVEIKEDLEQLLIRELDRMPEHVAARFLNGSITLLQARHATNNKHGRRHLARMYRMNAQIVLPDRYRMPPTQVLGVPRIPTNSSR